MFRMSNEMRELRAQIQTALNDLDAAIAEQDTDRVQSCRTEVERLHGLYDAAEAAFQARRGMEIDPDDESNPDDGAKPGIYDAMLFYKAISGQALNDAEKGLIAKAKSVYKNRFSEGSSKDGGLTVPDDLSKEIFSAIASTESVRNLVHIENVVSATGTRIFRNGQPIKLYNTAEREEMKELSNRTYEPVRYSQKKFAGMMEVSNELLEDSFVNFKDEFVEWMSEAARNTENAQIFYGAGGENHCQGMLSSANAYREFIVPEKLTIDFLRKVYLSVKQGYRTNGKWIMNSDAFAEISNIKYEDGRSCIQPNPKEKDSYVLFGFAVEIYDTIETEEGKTVLAFGDFKRAYRMFPRREFGVAFTDVGAGAFETDSVKARGTERFDGKVMDREAIVIVRDVPVVVAEAEDIDKELTGEMTEATLKNLTKNQLKDLAVSLGIEGVDTTQTKDEMVAAILAGAADDEAEV